MEWLSIGCIIMTAIGIAMLTIGFENYSFKLKLIGFLLACVGIVLIILVKKPTDNFTEWKESTEKTDIVEIEDGQYLIEMEDKYIYKAVTYSYDGENIPQYVEIKKDKNISVEITENTGSDEAYMVIFVRYATNAFGYELNSSDTTQTKYTFYIP